MRYHEFKINENVVQKVKDKVVNDFKRRKELFGKGKKPKKNIAEGMEARIQHLEDLVLLLQLPSIAPYQQLTKQCDNDQTMFHEA